MPFYKIFDATPCEGTVISWALPTQTGGLGHVNMKEEKDAIEAVEKWGFKVDCDLMNQV
jgi:hypothetical protein